MLQRMGLRRNLGLLALALGSIGVVSACEPSPPPPPAEPKTPDNLVSHAEYDAVTEGMNLYGVQTTLRKQLTLDYESSYSTSDGTVINQMWSYQSELGDCWQRVSFSFDNLDDNYDLAPELLLDAKYRSEFDCNGIVK